MRLKQTILIILILFTAGFSARAQLYSNDFENQYTWYPPWTNIAIAVDSSGLKHNYVCLCDSTAEYGLGLEFPVHDTLRGKNLHLLFEADYRFPDTTGQGEIVLTITKGQETPFWTSYQLAQYANDSAQWFHASIDMNIPSDYLEGGLIKLFHWNRNHNRIFIDNARLNFTPWTMPSFLPEVRHDSITEDSFVLRLDDSLQTPLTYPIGMLTEYILDGDTVTEYHLFTKIKDDRYRAVSKMDTTYVISFSQNTQLILRPFSRFYNDGRLLRQTVVVPFIDSTLAVYRRNMSVDTSLSQPEYYLDREGFKVGEGDHTVISYHQTFISSTQFDAINRIAFFNLDYWRDHPMIHYPLNDTVLDHFEDISCSPVTKGMEWDHFITLYIGDDIKNLPRIMPIPYGYESGIIFTEHADWSDIRTHRATYYGSERITKPADAIGGYVYYGIPVTKSVFYNNPDNVTNEAISQGTFTGLHATIKTDRNFEKFLKQLYKIGYDICLHTPEQYTTTPNNLKEALDYMRRNFKSVSWIDHGYNNSPKHNREDLVCDGLTLTADLWQKNGVKYLWNAYYEENRMKQWEFDNNLTQPYPGFGDALPNRQITPIVGHDYFLTWSTPSTLDANDDNDWDFYFNDHRVQKLIDNHSVHITHVYSPWVWPGRTFWTYDADSTIVARPGMNRAFERIASLRDEHKMLPMTVKTYLDYYSGLLQVYYEVIDSEHIRLQNFGKEVKGFTLLCPSPIRFEDNRFCDFRKSGDEYYVWFDLKSNDKVIIEIK